MAQVKFILLGTDNNPIANTEYSAKLTQTKLDYPGAIIFATYWDESNSNKLQEIYANGEKYSVGGGGGGVVYVGTEKVTNGIVETGSGKEVYKDGFSGTQKTDGKFNPGDIYIYKKSKDASSVESSGYVYVKAKDSNSTDHWEALAGAVSAENVWFNKGILRTETWGTRTTKEAEPKTEAVGLNLKELMEFYLVKQSWPTVIATKGTYTRGGFTVKDGGASITVKTSDDTAVGDYALINTPVTVQGLYTGTLTKTAAAATATLTAHKITEMTFGYDTYAVTDTEYKTKTGTKIDTSITGTYPTIKYKYNDNFTLGKRTSTLYKGGTALSGTAASKTCESTDATTTLETSGTSTITFGSNLFEVTNTNTSKWSRSITDDAGTTTYETTDTIKIPKLTSRVKYYDNKKSETDIVKDPKGVYDDYEITLSESVDSRTAKPSVSTASKTVTGYYPVYVGKVYVALDDLIGKNEWKDVSASDFTPYTGKDGYFATTNKSYDVELASGEGSAVVSIIAIVPSAVTSVTFTLKADGKEKTVTNSSYTKTKILDGNGKELSYKIYYQSSTQDSWAGGGKPVTVTIK